MTPAVERWCVASVLALALAPGATACRGSLGLCDSPERARAVVYDAAGQPAYEGQALAIVSCGHGTFCHAEAASGDDRLGAPQGLDFDVLPALDDEASSLERLRRAQDLVFEHRHAIWAEVEQGRMPPSGSQAAGVLEGAPRYRRIGADGDETPLPPLASEEGRRILRHWMACGSPVVQGTRPSGATEPVGYVEPAFETEPLEPRWPAIYEGLIEPRCASAPCHGLDEDGGLALGRGPMAAWSALVDQPAAGPECEGEGWMRVVAGDPEASLLVHKLRAHAEPEGAVCGDPMPPRGLPVSDADRTVVEQWIADGASSD
ncbi:MAG TPA: hypothetical protein RMH99_01075 [Sandaracinaceae bacterium LLY-WYZ-13_1]|nr:hypothetical protein [Sandaracinaceae bacterium LLY-WYZ-13_1]